MLSRAESCSVFNFIALCSILHIIPYKIHLKSGVLEIPSLKRFILWALVYFGSALHALNTIAEVLRLSTVGKSSIVIHHFPIQLDWSVCPTIVLTATGFIHACRSDLVCLIFNEMYKEDAGGKRKWTEFNLMELLAVYIPFFFISIPLCLGVIIILEPHMSHLIINTVIHSSIAGTRVAFWMAFVMELYAISVWVYNMGFFVVMIALVDVKVESELARVGHTCNREFVALEWRLRVAYKSCRVLHLYISLWNKVNALFMYSIKLVALFISISHWYFAIRYFDRNAFLGTYNLYLSMNAQIAYSVGFTKASAVRTGMEKRKAELLAMSHKLQRDGKAELYKKVVRSVRAVGITVGSFHEVERDSTLSFLNFVVNQTVGLLIAK